MACLTCFVVFGTLCTSHPWQRTEVVWRARSVVVHSVYEPPLVEDWASIACLFCCFCWSPVCLSCRVPFCVSFVCFSCAHLLHVSFHRVPLRASNYCWFAVIRIKVWRDDDVRKNGGWRTRASDPQPFARASDPETEVSAYIFEINRRRCHKPGRTSSTGALDDGQVHLTQTTAQVQFFSAPPTLKLRFSSYDLLNAG